jgi:hypothetical protein
MSRTSTGTIFKGPRPVGIGPGGRPFRDIPGGGYRGGPIRRPRPAPGPRGPSGGGPRPGWTKGRPEPHNPRPYFPSFGNRLRAGGRVAGRNKYGTPYPTSSPRPGLPKDGPRPAPGPRLPSGGGQIVRPHPVWPRRPSGGGQIVRPHPVWPRRPSGGGPRPGWTKGRPGPLEPSQMMRLYGTPDPKGLISSLQNVGSRWRPSSPRPGLGTLRPVSNLRAPGLRRR